jgi:hypothetical protein
MRINSSSVEAQQAELANRVRETPARPAPAGGAPAQPVSAVPKVDRVEISDAGRALAAQGGAESGAPTEMSAERLAELRQRVMSGAYNSLEVVDQVARRMLDAGDI